MMAPLEFEDCFIITESKRKKFIHYKLSHNNNLLTYGACIYRSLYRNINMTQIEMNNHKNTAYEYKRDDRYTIFSLKVPKFPDKDDLIIKIDNIIPITIAILTLFIAFIV